MQGGMLAFAQQPSREQSTVVSNFMSLDPSHRMKHCPFLESWEQKERYHLTEQKSMGPFVSRRDTMWS